MLQQNTVLDLDFTDGEEENVEEFDFNIDECLADCKTWQVTANMDPKVATWALLEVMERMLPTDLGEMIAITAATLTRVMTERQQENQE